MTERLHFHFSLSCIGKGNGNPLQCSWLENPRDGRALWAAIYGVAQSRTQLKRLRSSSSKKLIIELTSVQFSRSVMSNFVIPWIAARQASLSITNSQSSPKLMTIESVMPSYQLMLFHPLLLMPSNLSQHQGLFKWVSFSYQVAKVLEFQLQHQSFQWIFRTDFL